MKMLRLSALIFATFLALSIGRAPATTDTAPSAHWIVDASRPGPNSPLVGHSLFDKVFVNHEGQILVPYPFSALVAQLESRINNDEEPAVPTVLIPQGRSLHREAAAPNYYHSPRTVIYTNGEPNAGNNAGLQLRYRLFIGYQPLTNSLEVISYNTEFGRFEFQIVDNYRAGSTPTVRYANRTLCMSCHQNGAPIFSQTPWDETNFNATVASLIASARPDKYNSVLDAVSDDAAIIDIATDRANYFSAYQLLWTKGCGPNHPTSFQCRLAVLREAIRYRLSSELDFITGEDYQSHLLARMQTTWAEHWPAGLYVPSADIPDRNPTLIQARVDTDPLLPRAPQATWREPNDNVLRGMVTRLSEFFTAADIARYDRRLIELAGASNDRATIHRTLCTTYPEAQILRLECPAEWRSLTLAAELHETASGEISGIITGLRLPETRTLIRAHMPDTRPSQEHDGVHVHATLRSLDKSLSVRLANGARLTQLVISWPELPLTAPAATQIELHVVDDFAPMENALQSLMSDTLAGHSNALFEAPFQRALIVADLNRHLGIKPLQWCCDMSTTSHSHNTTSPKAGTTSAYQRYCSACHLGDNSIPPGFLYGDAAQVQKQLQQCAPRIYRRLGVWSKAPTLQTAQSLPPMPPPASLGLFAHDQKSWLRSEALNELRAATRTLLSTEFDNDSIQTLMQQDYQTLRSCLTTATH